MTLLFETEFTRVFYEKGLSDYSILSFSPFEEEFLFSANNFWGASFTRKNQVTCLALSAKSPNWYPYQEIRYIHSRLQEFDLDLPNLIGYGASMGGYAALKYGRKFNCKAVFAFSPQYSINANDMDYPSVYAKRYNPHLHQKVKITDDDLCDKNYVCYDNRHPEDNSHYHAIRTVNPLKITGLKCNYLGHKTALSISSSAKMNNLLENLLKNDTKKMREIIKNGRYDVPAYFGILAKYLYKKRPNIAKAVAEKGLFLQRTEGLDVIYFILSVLAQGDNNYSLAMQHGLKAYHLSPKANYSTNIEGIFNKKRHLIDDEAVKAYYHFDVEAKKALLAQQKKNINLALKINDLFCAKNYIRDLFILSPEDKKNEYFIRKLNKKRFFHAIKTNPFAIVGWSYAYLSVRFFSPQQSMELFNRLIEAEEDYADIFYNAFRQIKNQSFAHDVFKRYYDYFNAQSLSGAFLEIFFRNLKNHEETFNEESVSYFSLIQALLHKKKKTYIVRLYQNHLNKNYETKNIPSSIIDDYNLLRPSIVKGKKYFPHQIENRVAGKNSVIFAYSAQALQNSIYLLQSKQNYDAFLYDANNTDSLEDQYNILSRNININIKDLIPEICPEFSELDIETINIVKKISFGIGKLTHNYLSNSHLGVSLPSSDSFGLLFQDNTYQLLRRIISFVSVVKNYNTVYIFCPRTELMALLIGSLQENYPKKRIIFSHGMLVADEIKKFHHNLSVDLGLKQKEGDAPIEISQDRIKEISDSFAKRFSDIKKNGIFLSIIPQDGNYHKFGLRFVEGVNHRSVPLYLGLSTNKHEKSKEFLQKISTDYIMPADHADFPTGLLSFNNELHSVLNQFLQESNFRIKGLKLSYFLENAIKKFVHERVKYGLLYFNYVLGFFQETRPKLVFTSPGRSVWGWLIADAAEQLKITSLDIQVVLQSDHPRYYETKCDIMTFMDNEQYDLYKSAFPQCTKKHLLLGSVIFDEVKENLVTVNEKSRSGYIYRENSEKIVCVATQYSNGMHYHKIIQALVPLSEELGFKLLVKIHPRETVYYQKAFTTCVEASERAYLLGKEHDINQIIFESDIIITLFSNVGFLAALQNKNVIRPLLMEDRLPLDFVKIGIAEGTEGLEELKSMLKEVLFNPEKQRDTQIKREAYFHKNPFFKDDDDSIERIFKIEEVLKAISYSA